MHWMHIDKWYRVNEWILLFCCDIMLCCFEVTRMPSILNKKHCFPCLKHHFLFKFCCCMKTITVHWLDKNYDMNSAQTSENALHSLKFSSGSKPHPYISFMSSQCTTIVYICPSEMLLPGWSGNQCYFNKTW